jgi:hypothetical protein
MSMKGQSAMEYLMTYGWAILIVIIVAAALYALGIFNPATYTGRVPTGFTTLGTPEDWRLESNGDFSIILSNRLANTITIYEIMINLSNSGDIWNTFNCTGNDDYMTIGPGGSRDPSTVCPLADDPFHLNLGGQTSGTTYNVDVRLMYRAATGLDHFESGRVTGTVVT